MAEFSSTDVRHIVKALQSIAAELKKIRELKEKYQPVEESEG